MKRTSAILLSLVLILGVVASAGAAPGMRNAGRAVSAPVTITVYDSDGKEINPATATLGNGDTIEISVELTNTTGYTARVRTSGLVLQKSDENGTDPSQLMLGNAGSGVVYPWHASYIYKVQAEAPSASFNLIYGRVWSAVPRLGLPSWTSPGPTDMSPASPVSLNVSSATLGTEKGYEVTLGLRDQNPDLVAFEGTLSTTGLQPYHPSEERVSNSNTDIILDMMHGVSDITLYYVSDQADGARSIKLLNAYSAQAAQDVSQALPLKLPTYSLTVGKSEPDGSGTIQASVDGTVLLNPAQVMQGSMVTLTATPAQLYNFEKWNVTTVNGTVDVTPSSTTANPATFEMPGAPVTVSAIFTQKPTFAINLPVPSNGGISGPPNAVAGSTVVLTTTPHAGYMAQTVTVLQTASGTSVTVTPATEDPNKFSFVMPSADVTVSVQFVEGTAPTPSPSPTPTPSPSPTDSASPTSTATQSPTSTLVPSLPTLPPFKPIAPATAVPTPTAAPTATPMPTTTPEPTGAPTMQPNGLPEGVEVSANAPFEFVREDEEVQLTGLEAQARVDAATVGDLARYITLGSDMEYQVVDQDGDPVPNSAPLATGYMVEFEGSGEIVSGAIVIVQGDVLGTGIMSLSQLVRLAGAYGGTAQALEGPYLQAADFNADGRITLSDLVREAALYREATRR